MKQIAVFLGLICTSFVVNAQTLQAVTDNGASTTNTLNSYHPNGFQVTGSIGNPAYFVIDQTANLAGKRWRFGHTGAAAGFGSFDILNITDGIVPLSIQPNGKVGIGTITPSTLTEIKRTFASGAQDIDFLRLTSSQTGAWFSQLGLQFRWEDTGNGVAFNLAQVTAIPNWPEGLQSGGDLQFWTKSLNVSTESELTEKMRVTASGNVGIGTTTPNSKLAVNGNIRAHEIKVETAHWPDYVFAKDYQLPTLEETEKHIKEKGHLPGIPSAQEVKANGVDLGHMNAKLLQKIEELTLHLIEMKKDNDQIKTMYKQQQQQINNLNHKN